MDKLKELLSCCFDSERVVEGNDELSRTVLSCSLAEKDELDEAQLELVTGGSRIQVRIKKCVLEQLGIKRFE